MFDCISRKAQLSPVYVINKYHYLSIYVWIILMTVMEGQIIIYWGTLVPWRYNSAVLYLNVDHCQTVRAKTLKVCRAVMEETSGTGNAFAFIITTLHCGRSVFGVLHAHTCDQKVPWKSLASNTWRKIESQSQYFRVLKTKLLFVLITKCSNSFFI